MKRIFLITVGMFLLGTAAVFAGSKAEKFEVKGVCVLCEKRIEKAALSVDGVLKADWNKETKIIEVIFIDTKTDLLKIETAIAKVGHNTPNVKSTEEVFRKLPGCCQYSRSSNPIGVLEDGTRGAYCPKH